MYKIIQIDYHYYYQLEEELNNRDFELIQIIDISSSGDTERMHRATCLMKKIKT